MTENGKRTSVLRAPQELKAPATLVKKVARALEVRESSAKARAGKPLAFPTGRMRRR